MPPPRPPRVQVLLLGQPAPAIERLLSLCSQQGYDGLVLEAWNTWAAWGGFEARSADFGAAAVAFVEQLGAGLHAAGRQLLLAVPPVLPAAPGRPHIARQELLRLVEGGHVDGMSVMLYDHAGGAAGPNAPLAWQVGAGAAACAAAAAAAAQRPLMPLMQQLPPPPPPPRRRSKTYASCCSARRAMRLPRREQLRRCWWGSRFTATTT